MRHLSPTEILRRHAIERRLRASIRSANLDRDPNTAAPRMSSGQFVESCALVRGVPALMLDILGVYYCEAAGWTWREVLVEVQGEHVEVRSERSPVLLTLREAAERSGLLLTWVEVRAMHRRAIAHVADNMIARSLRADGASA